MKNHIIIVFLTLFTWNVKAQEPKITITGNTVFVEPMQEWSYQANISSVPNGATGWTCEWEISGTSQTVNYVDLVIAPIIKKHTALVKWNNTHNASSPKSIKVKVKYFVNGVPKTAESVVYGVTVRHLGNVISMNVAGTTLLANQSKNIACGAQNVAISVPTPVTDPVVAVVYTWTYPPGWNGPAQTNSPSVTANASAGGPGAIKVEARRSDGIIKTGIATTVTRPLPTKPTMNSGDVLLCNPKTIVATALNATSYDWLTTGGISANSNGGTNTANVTGVSDGKLKVRSYSSVCLTHSPYSSEITVKKSTPDQGAILVTANGGGAPGFMCNGAGVDLNVATGEPGISWGPWTVSDPANSFLNYSGPTAYFNSYVNSCYGIDITVSNCFGVLHKGITICVDDCGANVAAAYRVFPNPVKDLINIAFDHVDDFSALPASILLYSEKSGQQVKSINTIEAYASQGFKDNKKIEFDVRDLPRGTYFLHMSGVDGVARKLRIMLE